MEHSPWVILITLRTLNKYTVPFTQLEVFSISYPDTETSLTFLSLWTIFLLYLSENNVFLHPSKYFYYYGRPLLAYTQDTLREGFFSPSGQYDRLHLPYYRLKSDRLSIFSVLTCSRISELSVRERGAQLNFWRYTEKKKTLVIFKYIRKFVFSLLLILFATLYVETLLFIVENQYAFMTPHLNTAE
jgi:hypothetical protein